MTSAALSNARVHPHRGERRQDFIAAGWRCWAVGSYGDITVDDVCREAGMAKGSFYQYFSTKGDLLVALLTEDYGQVAAQLGEIEAASESAVQRLTEFARLVHQATDDPARCRARLDGQRLVSTDERFRVLLVDLTQARGDRLTAWIRRGVATGEFPRDLDVEGTLATFLALCSGIAVQGQGRAEGFSWVRLAPAVERMVHGFTVAA